MINNITEYNRIAVIEVNIEKSNNFIIVNNNYELALLIYRYKKSVVGKSFEKVINGKVDLPGIQELVTSFHQPIWHQFINGDLETSYNPLVSVVVCTHNRAEDLKNCLKSFEQLEYVNKEIIIVDNAPINLETKNLVLSYKDFKYINEPRKGLDIGRNRGIKESKGEIVAFTDDDAVADPFWLNGLVKNFYNPLVCVVTGMTMPKELETEAQILFEETNGFDRGFIRKEFNITNSKPVGSGRVGAGVNMALRKKITNDVGFFDEALDGGTYSLSGGDQEYFYRVLSKGYKIVYEPEALVWHKHRIEMISLKRTIYGYGVGVFAWWTKIVIKDKEFASIFFMIKWFFLYYFLNLFKSFFKIPALTFFKLSILELAGTLYGPFSYFRAKNSVKSINSTLTKH